MGHSDFLRNLPTCLKFWKQRVFELIVCNQMKCISLLINSKPMKNKLLILRVSVYTVCPFTLLYIRKYIPKRTYYSIVKKPVCAEIWDTTYFK